MVDGKETDVFGLKRGMHVSATKVVTVPGSVVSREKSVTGEMPPPPTVTAIQGPILIVVQKQPAQVAQANPPAAQPQNPAAAQPQTQKLPQTASNLPLLGFVGMLMVLSGVAVFVARSRKPV
jgi:LPXTG-motif cell wall-anchored protein